MTQCVNKRRFETEDEAISALDTIRGSYDAWLRDKVPRRAYACGVCEGWHLTSTAPIKKHKSTRH